MGTRRFQIFSLLLVAAFFVAVPRAEAARIEFGAEDDSMLFWDGANDVAAMNFLAANTNPVNLTSPDDLKVLYTPTNGFAGAASVFLMVTGAPDQTLTLRDSLCLGATSCAEYTRVQQKRFRGVTPEAQDAADALNAELDAEDFSYYETDLRLAFGAFLEDVDGDSVFTLKDLDKTAFNALLPLDPTTLHLGLIPFLSANLDTGAEQTATFEVLDPSTTPTPIPEPSTLLLLGTGAAVTAARRRKAAQA
jgi:hypothetical protein